MPLHVFSLRQDLQILGCIVQLVAVNVMDNLARTQGTAKLLFRNHAMLMTTIALPVGTTFSAATQLVRPERRRFASDASL